MLDGEWEAAPPPAAARDLLAAGVDPLLAPLLARRGLNDAAAAAAFLAPDLDQLHDPHDLAGLDAALELFAVTHQRGGSVWVVGDYDVDGVAATALLLASFRACGLAAQPRLPHRMEDGYGLQPSHVDEAIAAGAALLVATDCGTSARAALDRAAAAGLPVVVIDHHLPQGDPHPHAVVVNPRQPGCRYPCRDLAAAGLAFKVAVALGERLGRPLPVAALLRVACLGTIADMVPLLGENRVIAALGLTSLAGTRSPGLRQLMRQARLQPPLRATDIGFRLCPRLNAAGRLGSALPALELLLTRDAGRAAAISRELEGLNGRRQDEERRVVEEAGAIFAARSPPAPILVAWREGWHRGVVGIAASRLARELRRPVVLLSVDGARAVGSGRSVPGIELFEFLAPWQPRLERFGGHAQAIGMTVATAALESLHREWLAAAAGWPAAGHARRHLYELTLPAAAVGADLWRRLQRLEPHGEGNPQPLLRVGPLRLTRPPRPFGRGHLRARAQGADGAAVGLLG
ncbi:MAG TPA: single-stranded-DNA-specific exonuclease RecJ, partial [Thermoanaerobaculia bacterium]|nr:single-stranded-DNA-specific exonuclease RecJ [Thermoanaerobaculia bacterium]